MLSAHSLLVGLEWDRVPQLPNATHQLPDPEEDRWYHGELLEMSADLGERLLPAFDTPSGIPYHRINLKYGVPANEDTDTCTTGAGTLQLEFGLLSEQAPRQPWGPVAATGMCGLVAARAGAIEVTHSPQLVLILHSKDAECAAITTKDAAFTITKAGVEPISA